MAERNLARFRADPKKVRVSLRPNRGGWDIYIQSIGESTDDPYVEHAPSAAEVPRHMMHALMWCYGAKMPGIDPYMDWAYEHPFNVNQYRDFERVERDNEMLRALGEHPNELH